MNTKTLSVAAATAFTLAASGGAAWLIPQALDNEVPIDTAYCTDNGQFGHRIVSSHSGHTLRYGINTHLVNDTMCEQRDNSGDSRLYQYVKPEEIPAKGLPAPTLKL